jgi:hypothetical protein
MQGLIVIPIGVLKKIEGLPVNLKKRVFVFGLHERGPVKR